MDKETTSNYIKVSKTDKAILDKIMRSGYKYLLKDVNTGKINLYKGIVFKKVSKVSEDKKGFTTNNETENIIDKYSKLPIDWIKGEFHVDNEVHLLYDLLCGIDWQIVPVDTLVFVSKKGMEGRYLRYFQSYDYSLGIYYTYPYGSSSQTYRYNVGHDEIFLELEKWDFASLYFSKDNDKYRKVTL